MKFYEIELNGETIKFRLTTADSMTIEKKTGKSILEFIGEIGSITNITMMLMYMVRSSTPTFSEKDATALFDKLIDNGYTISTIINNIILETLQVSGFMSAEELQQMKDKKASNK